MSSSSTSNQSERPPFPPQHIIITSSVAASSALLVPPTHSVAAMDRAHSGSVTGSGPRPSLEQQQQNTTSSGSRPSPPHPASSTSLLGVPPTTAMQMVSSTTDAIASFSTHPKNKVPTISTLEDTIQSFSDPSGRPQVQPQDGNAEDAGEMGEESREDIILEDSEAEAEGVPLPASRENATRIEATSSIDPSTAVHPSPLPPSVSKRSSSVQKLTIVLPASKKLAQRQSSIQPAAPGEEDDDMWIQSAPSNAGPSRTREAIDHDRIIEQAQLADAKEDGIDFDFGVKLLKKKKAAVKKPVAAKNKKESAAMKKKRETAEMQVAKETAALLARPPIAATPFDLSMSSSLSEPAQIKARAGSVVGPFGSSAAVTTTTTKRRKKSPPTPTRGSPELELLDPTAGLIAGGDAASIAVPVDVLASSSEVVIGGKKKTGLISKKRPRVVSSSDDEADAYDVTKAVEEEVDAEESDSGVVRAGNKNAAKGKGKAKAVVKKKTKAKAKSKAVIVDSEEDEEDEEVAQEKAGSVERPVAKRSKTGPSLEDRIASVMQAGLVGQAEEKEKEKAQMAVDSGDEAEVLKENQEITAVKASPVKGVDRVKAATVKRSFSNSSSKPTKGLAGVLNRVGIYGARAPGLSSKTKLPRLLTTLNSPPKAKPFIPKEKPKPRKKGDESYSDEERPWYETKYPEEWDSDDHTKYKKIVARREAGYSSE